MRKQSKKNEDLGSIWDPRHKEYNTRERHERLPRMKMKGDSETNDRESNESLLVQLRRFWER